MDLLSRLLAQLGLKRAATLKLDRPCGEILADPEEGFADLTFSLVEAREDGRAFEFTARGTHRGHPVAFRARIVPDGAPPKEIGPVMSQRCEVTLFSIGTQSDALLAALAEVYRGRAEGRMREALSLTALSLQGDPNQAFMGEVKLKLFHEDPTAPEWDDSDPEAEEPQTDYFELYLNLNAQHGVVELREKDEAYRAPILRVLSKDVGGAHSA